LKNWQVVDTGQRTESFEARLGRRVKFAAHRYR
jgi:hypothetical protein